MGHGFFQDTLTNVFMLIAIPTVVDRSTLDRLSGVSLSGKPKHPVPLRIDANTKSGNRASAVRYTAIVISAE